MFRVLLKDEELCKENEVPIFVWERQKNQKGSLNQAFSFCENEDDDADGNDFVFGKRVILLNYLLLILVSEEDNQEDTTLEKIKN